MNKNVIQLRSGFINVPTSRGKKNLSLAMSVAAELMQFGYILDPVAIEMLSNAGKATIETFYNETITYLKKMTGANRSYSPFWSGFPKQVMEMSECELWMHQIVHYLSNGTYTPNEWTKTRRTAFEQPKYTVLVAGDEERFLKIFTDLVSVNQSLTPDDLEIIKWFVSSGTELRMPEVIPFKENLCTLAGMYLNVPVKTVTDVLRIAVSMSGGDISLPKVPVKMIRKNSWSSKKSTNPARKSFEFRNFTRAERRYLLNLLNQTNCDVTEAVLKEGRWIRLGELLHPGEYKNKFKKAFKMFDTLRNNRIQSWYGKVNAAFERDFEAGVTILAERPGEFVRRLDWMLRKTQLAPSPQQYQFVLDTFASIASKVSNKVLFESYSHFEKRINPVTNRSIMIKGKRKHTKLPDLPAISSVIVNTVQELINSSLQKRFSKLESLGEVWIDERLKNIPLPSNMRSLNSSLKPRVRGVRIPMGNQKAKVIRAFVHWFDEHGSRDVDLTATYIGINQIRFIGWNGIHASTIGVYSGDVRNRRGACAEYVDININNALKEGFKYVVVDARNYYGGSLGEITDCVFGWMERERPTANLIFRPDTLANTVRLQSSASTTLVAVIDLETQEYIFLDIDQSGIPVATANIQAILEALAPYMEPPKFSVYDLITLHVNAREGQLVPEGKAKIKYEFDQFANSYVEILKLMGV